MKLMINTRINC